MGDKKSVPALTATRHTLQYVGPGIAISEGAEGIVKVVVDRTRCAGLGLCEAVAPDIFEVDDAGDLVLRADAVSDTRRGDLEDAVSGCPTQALAIEE